MSTFIVRKSHIDYLVTAAFNYGFDFNCAYDKKLHLHSYDELGQILWDENHRAFDYRYKEFTNRDVYKFTRSKNTTAIQFLKAINCMIYQIAETKDYEDSHAYYILEMMKRCAIEHLPDYDTAQWEVV